ncbi:MAG: sugar MFS transporter [Rhodothalassiaceae bacterium]
MSGGGGRARWQKARIILALVLIYFVFAILLNSVGTVILQSINSFGVSKTGASVLEGFKDISIAVVSFAVASFLPRFGYRRAMIAALALVLAAALAMPAANSFLATKIMFLATGIGFALVKVSVYSTIGLITGDRYQHAGLMNVIEGIFMIGVLAGYWLFGHFIGDGAQGDPGWLDVYYVLAALCALTIALLLSTPFDGARTLPRTQGLGEDFLGMLRLALEPLVLLFVLSAFLYVLIEQGIGTWLPTFNNQVLKLPSAMSVQVASIFAASLAVGRLGAGAILRRVDWYPVLVACVLAMGTLVLLTLPLTRGLAPPAGDGWQHLPLAAFLLPLIGVFMAPVYPAINSAMLSALPREKHSAMTGLIVIFSALGGTTGSLITGFVFGHFDGQTAFYFSLLPMGAILVTLSLFRRALARHRVAPVSGLSS